MYRKLRISLIWFCLCLIISACQANTASTPLPTQAPVTEAPVSNESPADVIFYNGDVLVMDEALTQEQALAVRGDTIVGVGTDEEMMALAGSSTQLIDLQGAALLPGFIDPHTHLLNDANYYGKTPVEIQQFALENGFTTIASMFTSPEFLTELEGMNERGEFRIRVNAYLNYNTNCGDVIGDWFLEHPPHREPGGMFWINGVKVFADGGSCKTPALSVEFAPGQGLGDLFITTEELSTVIEKAESVGHQVAVHAIGDRAIETVMDAYSQHITDGHNTFRHRIEHNSVIRPDLLPRYGELDLVALIFGTYSSCRQLGTPPPAAYEDWVWPWRDLISANPDIHIAWHGDDPSIEPVSPVLELYGFVTRYQVLDDRETICAPPDFAADDILPVEVALPMMNREAAYALFREKEVGTLEVGKLADLVILSKNPLAIPAEELLDTEVWMTMVGGVAEYCAPGQGDYCPGS